MMRKIDNHAPLKFGFYDHKTPYTKDTVAELLPELKILLPGQSFLVEIEDDKLRGACSKAITAAISAARTHDLLPMYQYKVAVQHAEKGVRIWRIK